MKTVRIQSQEGLTLIAQLLSTKQAHEARVSELEARFKQEVDFLHQQAAKSLTDIWEKLLQEHKLTPTEPEIHMLDISYLKEHGLAFIRIEEGGDEAEQDEGDAESHTLFPAPETVQ